MKIGLDIFSYDKPGTNSGVGPSVYVWKLLPELFQQGNHHQYLVFVNKDNKNQLPLKDNVKIIVSPFSNRFRLLRVLHEQLFLPYQFWKHKLSMVHFFGNNISYLLFRNAVFTILDLMWKYYLDRKDYSLKNIYFGLTIPISIRLSHSIITISKYIATEIQDQFQREKNIYPILIAPGDVRNPNIEHIEMFSKRYNYEYIYTVTTSMPHKNLILLLESYKQIFKNKQFSGKLIISGQLKGNYHYSTRQFIRFHQLENEIILTGFISDEEKSYCYQHALVFVYPSLYEGFGMPILEAMISGTPVLCSNAASIPEVGGDACLYFDPHNADDIYSKLLLLINDSSKRKEMAVKGKIQSGKFDWQTTAIETLKVYKEMSNSKNGM